MVRATLSSRNELQPTVAPPGFCNRGEVRYESIGGLEYEAPQKLTHYTVHREFVGFGICRVIRRSSMTMKAHTYYIIFGRPPTGGKLSPFSPSGGATDSRDCLIFSHSPRSQGGPETRPTQQSV